MFWSHTKTTKTNKRFLQQLCQKQILSGFSSEQATDLQEVQQFLHSYFRIHPDVIYNIPLKELEQDFVLIVRIYKKLVGCIRYHYVGTIEEDIHLVDCFCVHPEWRGKGIGDFLLHDLHHRMMHKPYAIFLKEGSLLPAIPFYSSMYAYRFIKDKPVNNIIEVPTKNAYRLMQIYKKSRDFFMIARPTDNQYWRLYKNGIHSILACVQDTYQTLHGKRMGWITAWIESPGITDTMRGDASYQLSEVPGFDMIWMDWNYCNKKDWIMDGEFHWYTYQWTSGISIDKSYCFIH
jgi:predicted N-acetyltransferase YhbS